MIETKYKQTEAGLIPCEWDIIKLGDCFEFKNGLNASKDCFGYGTPIVNYMDVYHHAALRSHHIAGLVNLSPSEIARFRVQKADVFFTRTSETPEEVGFASVLLDDVTDCVFSGFVLRARPINTKLYPEYCAYCFKTAQVRNAIIKSCSYTTRALTNGKVLSEISIPLPPLAEQKKIAKALSDVDALINELGELIAKKRDIKQGTMQQLLTGKKRLPGFTDEWNCNAMWELTAWDKFFSEVEKGKQKKVIRYPYLLAANMEAMEQANGNVYLLATGNYEGWTTEEIAGNHLCEGEVVSIPWGGYANIKYTKGKFVTADNRIATSLDTSILDNKFLYYYMLQNKKTFDSFYRGAGIQHPSMADVLDFEILYPTIDEQRAIATILTDMDDEIQALEAKRDKYTAIKQGMMQELLTGKIRLV
jgi:type I restriction enzyme S subunit